MMIPNRDKPTLAILVLLRNRDGRESTVGDGSVLGGGDFTTIVHLLIMIWMK